MEVRYEEKFPLTLDGVAAFRYWLEGRGEGARFRTAFPARVVNSIYFDSPDLAAYLDGVEGAASRRKVRLRWYGATLEPGSSRFEIKARCNGCGTKHVCEIAAPLPLEPHRSLPARLRRVLPADERLVLDFYPLAVLFNRYRREYYASPEGIRLTVDSEIVSRKLVGGRLRLPPSIPGDLAGVVEVKYPVDAVRAARRALATLPALPSKNSKYTRAVESWI
jgi:hypothetical protein